MAVHLHQVNKIPFEFTQLTLCHRSHVNYVAFLSRSPGSERSQSPGPLLGILRVPLSQYKIELAAGRPDAMW